MWESRSEEKFKSRALHYGAGERGFRGGALEGGRDPVARLKDMAADGITAEVIYPTTTKDIFLHQGHDPELAEASARVYNDWMIEYCQEAPDRLWGQALILLWDIEGAILEMERCRKAGLIGATTWIIPPEDLPFKSPHYERFWAAAQDLDMPVSMHINQGFGMYVDRRTGPIDEVESIRLTTQGHKLNGMNVFTEIICSGVLERHPRLKVIVAELEVGWIPFFIQDLDRRFIKSKLYKGGEVPLLPSEYFARQCYSTFTSDEVGGHLLDRWGMDNFMWSNDYPHPGSIWPYSDEVIARTLGDLSSETQAKVLADNVARVYGMPIPEPMPRTEAPDMEELWGKREWIQR
jgi:predicted TIM-barrel fold metal-dependent hydrolase